MDYKDTLNMPKTEFEMRGNLAKKEPGILEAWEKNDHYNAILKQHEGKQEFVLHDGPPYANGNLHAGTAMNRIIKDFIVRTHAMHDMYTPFFPGWDTHGLPIENAVQKLGVDRKKVSAAEFRRQCEEYARGQLATQMATEKRLGQIADYEHPYITLNKEFEARQIRSFAKMALSGMIFQGLKPIHWSPYQETAIADSEIVYFDRKDPTIYVTFDVKDGKGLLDTGDKFVIWTTTPWTLPANVGITLHPEFDYVLVNTEKGNLLFLKSMKDALLEKFELNGEVVKTFKGKELEGISCTHCLYPEKESMVLLADYVTDEDGTGCVHTAGGHGLEDFSTTQRYGLPTVCPVDEKGEFTSEAGSALEGKFVLDANKDITVTLDEAGSLLKLEWITHSYPHDDRLKKPVIFRATTQWFASIEKIKPELLKAIEEVEWLNSFGQVRLTNMIKDRRDWCISRQRLWGVPIPIIYNEDKTPIIEEAVFEHIAELFEEYGSNVWFEREAKDLLPEGYTNEKSPNGLFTKESDIMDVWFDSGSSWNELVARGYKYPCDIYFEGSDQYRGWFNSSLSVSVATNGVAPYKAVLSHGYVCDSKGEAMHKSVGNVVDPIDIINQYGADILRLWAASSDFTQDMRIGDSNLKQVSDQYRKIRNTFRFLLGNLAKEDFDPKKDLLTYEQLEEVDQYILVRLNEVVKTVKDDVLKYDYLDANKTLMNFMVNELSSYYCDFTKDILYCEKKDALRRRQVQSVYYKALDALVKLWAPFLVYTCEEVWSFFSNDEKESVHYCNYPEVEEYANAEELKAKFATLLEVRSRAMKALEDKRAEKEINSNQEADIELVVNEEEKALLEATLAPNIAQWLIVSKASLSQGEAEVKVKKASGTKCPRCWNYSEEADENGLCPRCHEVMA
ncbi:MAG: isoleucine--tRNA ligase [Solobacterium sp.]|nr:isoleucine--tRNA ligase [Solobacterium sp.]